jgi:GxxExxY protein
MNREDAKNAKQAMIKMDLESLAYEIIGACIEVHRFLGPGLLESAYEACLARELELSNIPFERQKPLPVAYKGIQLDCGYRLDLLVDQQLVVELKAVDSIQPIHEAQMLTYLRMTGCSLGLLANFHAKTMKDGLRRMVLNHPD